MAEFATQQGLFEALSALGLKVFDVQPQAPDGGSSTNFPCVTVGAIVLAAWDTKDNTGFDFIARVKTHSRSASMKEAKDIQSTIYKRLHRGVITISGFHLVDLMRETSDVMAASDGSFQGVCEYRGLIEKSVT